MTLHSTLIYIGSVAITAWGIGHLIATRSVVAGFDSVSSDNRRIITMEWILEGLTLCFLGVLAGTMVATGQSLDTSGGVVIWACAVMLLVMAMVSAATGARTSVGPMRACPFVKTSVAILLVAGNLLG
jgi:hypothetical protein